MNDIIRAFLEGASELDVVDMCSKDEEDSYLDDEIEQEYVSCIKINGVPILPPVMTPALRMECREWRRKALEVQQRIQLQKIEKSSQMDSCRVRKNSQELDLEDEKKLLENESEEVEEDFDDQQNFAVDITPRTFEEMKLEMVKERNKPTRAAANTFSSKIDQQNIPDLQINNDNDSPHGEELEGSEEFVSEKQDNIITDPSEDVKSKEKHKNLLVNELDSDIEKHLKVNKNVITPRTFEEIKLEMIKERERKRCQYTPDLWTDDEASVMSSVSSDISSSTNSSNKDLESESTRPVSSLSLNLESLSSRIESELESSDSRRVYSSLKYCDESHNNNLNNGQYDSLLSINTVIENPSYSVASNSIKQVLDQDNLNEDTIILADKENNISESAPRQRRGSYTLEKPSPVLLAHWQRMGSQGDVSKRSDISRDKDTATISDLGVSKQGDFHKEQKFIKRSFPDLSQKYTNNDLIAGAIEHVQASSKDLPPSHDNGNLSSLTDINVKKQMMTIDKSDLLNHYLESLTSPISQPKIPPRSSSSIEKLANNFTETVIVDDDVSTSVVDSSVSDDDTVSFVDSEISIPMDYSRSSVTMDRQARKSDVIKSAELTDNSRNENDNSRNVNQESLENVISHLAIQQQTSFKELLEKQEEQRKQLREQFEQQQKEMVSQIVDQFPGILLKGEALIENGRNSPNHMLSNSILETSTIASLNSPNHIDKTKTSPKTPFNQHHLERSQTLSANPPKATFLSKNQSTSSTKTAQSPMIDKSANSRSSQRTHSGDKLELKQGNASQSSTVDKSNSSDLSSWRINDSVQSLKITGVAVKPKKETLKIPPEALSPSLNPAWTRLTAIARGFLTRRLMETDKVQNIVATIKDTLTCAVVLHNDAKGLPTRQDLALHARLLAQLEASCNQLHQVFFKLGTREKMALLAQNRELKKKRKSGKIAKRLSAATEARIKQRVENDVTSRRERKSVGKRRQLKKYSSGYNKVSVKRSSTFVIKSSSNKSAAVSPRPSRRFTPSPTPSRLSKMASKRSLSSPTLVSSKLSARRSASSPTIKLNSSRLLSKRSGIKYNQKPWK